MGEVPELWNDAPFTTNVRRLNPELVAHAGIKAGVDAGHGMLLILFRALNQVTEWDTPTLSRILAVAQQGDLPAESIGRVPGT